MLRSSRIMKHEHSKIAVIMDRSGSMASVHEATVNGYNEFLNGQKLTPGTADLMLVMFDDQYEVRYDQPLTQVAPMLLADFVPRGSTALNDAIGRTIVEVGATLARMPEPNRAGKVILVILTDGEENASKEFTREKLARMIGHQRDVYKWDFVFLGANQDAILIGNEYNIPASASITYNANPVAMANVMRSAAAYTSNARSGRAQRSFSEEDRLGAAVPAKSKG